MKFWGTEECPHVWKRNVAKECGRSSKKCTALSFASASTAKKSRTDLCTKPYKLHPYCTYVHVTQLVKAKVPVQTL